MDPFPERIHSKLPQTGTSVFAVMSGLAKEHNAINLSQGFPDFPVSEHLINLVHKYMQQGQNQYAPMPGVPALREAIAEKTQFLYSASYNPETEITVTAGATQAIFTAITAFIREEDEVIIFEPAYDSYLPAIKLCGATPISIQLKLPDYHIDWNEVKRKINQRTKMIIINSPHNPTGSILSAADLTELDKLTRNSGILVLSDEVYEHIIFDGHVHQSVCRYPHLASRSLVMCSFGKTFHATGWKTGYCLAPENLMKEFRKTHQFVVFAVNTPAQYAIAEYIQNKDNYLNLGSFYQEKRDYFLKLVSGSRFKAIPARGTYFQVLDYSNISDEPEMDFAVKLTKDFGVASVPNSYFYNNSENNQTLRFCFAKSNETLEKAAEILCRI
ncbi:MAG: aminotransferase class I/II-fold pyridoxal phosphate-dependent enzyme [Bacteroidetes bacterium]|nr:MAG: aminotransferase class I/II-fold pyridoxal phosphate-dependent enzyme [Bacteroidota bacterium]